MCICTIYDEARYRLLQLSWRNCICSRKCAQVSLESLMYIWLYFLQFLLLLPGNGFHVQFLQFPSSYYYSTLSGFCRYWVSCNKKLYSLFFRRWGYSTFAWFASDSHFIIKRKTADIHIWYAWENIVEDAINLERKMLVNI